MNNAFRSFETFGEKYETRQILPEVTPLDKALGLLLLVLISFMLGVVLSL